MVFKWHITRPAYEASTDGVSVMQAGVSCDFETGSIAEGLGIFQDNRSALSELFPALMVQGAIDLAADINPDKEEAPEGKKERKKREPKADPVAPAPIEIPPAPAMAPVPGPPLAPALPPTGVLAGKIAAELEKRATGAADGGQALADWLATSGITVKGATFPEAVEVLRLQADDKLTGIATALGV